MSRTQHAKRNTKRTHQSDICARQQSPSSRSCLPLPVQPVRPRATGLQRRAQTVPLPASKRTQRKHIRRCQRAAGAAQGDRRGAPIRDQALAQGYTRTLRLRVPRGRYRPRPSRGPSGGGRSSRDPRLPSPGRPVRLPRRRGDGGGASQNGAARTGAQPYEHVLHVASSRSARGLGALPLAPPARAPGRSRDLRTQHQQRSRSASLRVVDGCWALARRGEHR